MPGFGSLLKASVVADFLAVVSTELNLCLSLHLYNARWAAARVKSMLVMLITVYERNSRCSWKTDLQVFGRCKNFLKLLLICIFSSYAFFHEHLEDYMYECIVKF